MSKLLFVFITLFSVSASALPSLKRVQAMPTTFTTAYNFEGIVALSNCSGSLVRFENSKDTDNAMVFTNGHCYEGGFIPAGKFVINRPSSRGFTVLDPQSNELGNVRATTVLYATMTNTDVSIYKLKETYADILQKYNTRPLTLSSKHPAAGTSIEIISGYWQRGYACKIDTFVNALREGDYTWFDSIRYTSPGCEVIGGTSGSPVIEAGSRTMIGINNTGNEDGEKCTDNNPCEIDKSGNITYQKGWNYAEETYLVYTCLNSAGQFDANTAGCMLPH